VLQLAAAAGAVMRAEGLGGLEIDQTWQAHRAPSPVSQASALPAPRP
jgi:hypothetical protein